MAKDTYETFDSTGGPIGAGDGVDSSRDSAGGLKADNEADDEQGAVPEVPSVKR